MKKILFACFTVFSLLLPAYAAESVMEDKKKSEKVEKPNSATSPCLFRVYYPYAAGSRQLINERTYEATLNGAYVMAIEVFEESVIVFTTSEKFYKFAIGDQEKALAYAKVISNAWRECRDVTAKEFENALDTKPFEGEKGKKKIHQQVFKCRKCYLLCLNFQ